MVARHEQTPFELIRKAAGSPRELRAKAARLASVLRGYADRARLDDRLERLRRRGVVEAIPTRVQLVVGAIDMLRFWISPAAADYYEQQNISYAFHQVLRLLDEPASLTDPVGLFSEEDGIIGHLMQVVHANPVYDLQLLCMFDRGVDHLEEQLEQMLAGTHPRAESIGAIVEEADYHANLLDFIRRWRKDPTIPPLLRSNVATSTEYSALERTFGTMTGAFRYFTTMPQGVISGAIHLYTVRTFVYDAAQGGVP